MDGGHWGGRDRVQGLSGRIHSPTMCEHASKFSSSSFVRSKPMHKIPLPRPHRCFGSGCSGLDSRQLLTDPFKLTDAANKLFRILQNGLPPQPILSGLVDLVLLLPLVSTSTFSRSLHISSVTQAFSASYLMSLCSDQALPFHSSCQANAASSVKPPWTTPVESNLALFWILIALIICQLSTYCRLPCMVISFFFTCVVSYLPHFRSPVLCIIYLLHCPQPLGEGS